MDILSTDYLFLSVAPGRGTPEHRNVPPPHRNRKHCCINLVLSPRDIYFRSGVRNPRKIQEKIVKKSIFHRTFQSKNLKIFLTIFKILFIFGPNAENFGGPLVTFTCSIEISHHILMSMHFSINSSRFSSKISRIFMPFSIDLLYLSYF